MTKRYQCPYCSKPLTHTECYRHCLYECPKRPIVIKGARESA